MRDLDENKEAGIVRTTKTCNENVNDVVYVHGYLACSSI